MPKAEIQFSVKSTKHMFTNPAGLQWLFTREYRRDARWKTFNWQVKLFRACSFEEEFGIKCLIFELVLELQVTFCPYLTPELNVGKHGEPRESELDDMGQNSL